MSPRPSAAARRWDAAALVLVLCGGGAYVAAHLGMRSIIAQQVHAATIDAPNLVRWNNFRLVSNAALALVGAGLAVGIASYLRARRAPELPPA